MEWKEKNNMKMRWRELKDGEMEMKMEWIKQK